MNTVTRRIATTLNHLNPGDSLNTEGCSGNGGKQTFNVQKMTDLLYSGCQKEVNERVHNLIANNPDHFKFDYTLSKEQYREYVLKQITLVARSKLWPLRMVKKDPERFFATMRAFNFDTSAGVKCGVQFLLWGGSILNLGTARHIDKYLDKIETLELPGIFAMTEMGHGSNVRGIETTATYDKKTQEFIINTPSIGATKFWLGNAACHGVMATVFARLILDGNDKGVHAFVVPIRDQKTMKALPGIRVGDCGEKVGLNGVDNGWIQFDHVRIPRENLLNRFADVSPDGQYSCQFRSEAQHFGAVLGELTTGRVSITLSSIVCLQTALTIAVRFCDQRRQFGPAKTAEISILDYRTHQMRMMPILATCYAMEITNKFLIKRYGKLQTATVRNNSDVAEVHALSAGMKAYVTWFTQRSLGTLREMCGGYGYAAINRLGRLREDHDIFQTFEGDNTVLMQQVAHYLFKKFRDQFKGNQIKGVLRYMQERSITLMRDRNPVVTRFSSESHLRNQEFQLQAFEYRTARLIELSLMELRAAKQKYKDVFHQWNSCLPRILQLANSYIEQIMVENFVKAIEGCPDIELQYILRTLCDLFALSRIDNDIGSFMGLIKRNKATAIHALVLDLCKEVRTHAVSLVDAFNIPDYYIAAPIGLKQGDYLTNMYKHLTGELKIPLPGAEHSTEKPEFVAL